MIYLLYIICIFNIISITNSQNLSETQKTTISFTEDTTISNLETTTISDPEEETRPKILRLRNHYFLPINELNLSNFSYFKNNIYLIRKQFNHSNTITYVKFIFEEEDLTLSCGLEGTKLDWFYENFRVERCNHSRNASQPCTIEDSENLTLTVKNISKFYSGLYDCQAREEDIQHIGVNVVVLSKISKIIKNDTLEGHHSNGIIWTLSSIILIQFLIIVLAIVYFLKQKNVKKRSPDLYETEMLTPEEQHKLTYKRSKRSLPISRPMDFRTLSVDLN